MGQSALVRGDGAMLRNDLPVQSPAPSLTAWKGAGKGGMFSTKPCKENLRMGKSFDNLNSRDYGLSGSVKRRK